MANDFLDETEIGIDSLACRFLKCIKDCGQYGYTIYNHDNKHQTARDFYYRYCRDPVIRYQINTDQITTDWLIAIGNALFRKGLVAKNLSGDTFYYKGVL